MAEISDSLMSGIFSGISDRVQFSPTIPIQVLQIIEDEIQEHKNISLNWPKIPLFSLCNPAGHCQIWAIWQCCFPGTLPVLTTCCSGSFYSRCRLFIPNSCQQISFHPASSWTHTNFQHSHCPVARSSTADSHTAWRKRSFGLFSSSVCFKTQWTTDCCPLSPCHSIGVSRCPFSCVFSCPRDVFTVREEFTSGFGFTCKPHCKTSCQCSVFSRYAL